MAAFFELLRKGQRWDIRSDFPFFGATAEGNERLDLPAGKQNGMRIRIDSELFGENDRVYIWYSRDGFLRLHVVIESEMTDENGNSTQVPH